MKQTLRLGVDEKKSNVFILMERESTSKFPRMVIWKMCSPFDLDLILLGVYVKQTEVFTKMVIQILLVQ